jgi:site-specific DNA-cytosine methylase
VLAFAQNTRNEVRIIPDDKACALAAQPGMKQTNYVLTYDARGNGEGVVANALTGDHQNRVTDYTAIVLRNREGKPGGGKGPLLSAERSLTLGTANDQVVFAIQNPGLNKAQNGLGITDGTAPMYSLESVGHGVVVTPANDQVVFTRPPITPTLSVGAHNAAPGLNGQDQIAYVEALHQSGVGIPRRLTPVECERLMGWPDGWTAEGIDEAGERYALSDTARYKACGNGVASPVAAWIGFRLREVL